MKTLIVYDSIFGNTEKISQTIGDSLDSQEQFEIVHVKDITTEHLKGLELLIVGSPTRAFKPTPVITDFLNKIPAKGLQGVKVAAFDTRISTTEVNSKVLKAFVKVFGYAAKLIADKLVRKGGILALPPEGFIVKDNEGPLQEGEEKRAEDWARLVGGGKMG